MLHHQNLAVHCGDVMAELVWVLVYELSSFLPVRSKEEGDRSGRVRARKQVRIDRVGTQQDGYGVVTSQICLGEGLGVDWEGLELELNLPLAGRGDRPADTGTVVGFIGAEGFEVVN